MVTTNRSNKMLTNLKMVSKNRDKHPNKSPLLQVNYKSWILSVNLWNLNHQEMTPKIHHLTEAIECCKYLQI